MNSRFPGAFPRFLSDTSTMRWLITKAVSDSVWIGAEELRLAGISKETAGCFWRTQTFEKDTATLAQC